jgi:hypothetical protein
MRTWYSTVVLAIYDKGPKRVELQQIYTATGKFRTLSDHDREPHPKYPQENFKHTTRSVLVKLKKYGLVEQDDRAVYSLAKKSVERIETFRADTYGRSVGGEIDLAELIARFGFMSRREA